MTNSITRRTDLTPDDVRDAWWRINGLIVALDIVNEAEGRDGIEARASIVRALRDRARPFSRLVEAVADDADCLKPGDREAFDLNVSTACSVAAPPA